jgi:diaminopimelate epimerase
VIPAFFAGIFLYLATMKIPFTKMSGAGNDFVVVDRRSERKTADWKGLTPLLCDRRRGVGADGLIVIRPGSEHDFIMEYYNADGSTGSMCGNGGRCAAAYVLGSTGAERTSFQSCGRIYKAVATQNGILLSMDDPGRPEMEIRIDLPGVDIPGHFIDSGSPHLVLITDSPDFHTVDIRDTGRKIRNLQHFSPGGTNVDFIKIMGEGEIAVRTYERGVEDETWACGTGAVASAIIYVMKHGGEGVQTIGVTPKSGEKLTVNFRKTGGVITDVKLEGPAVMTFTGTFDTEVPGV